MCKYVQWGSYSTVILLHSVYIALKNCTLTSSRTGITGSNRFEQNSLKNHIHGYIQACSASFQEWVSLSMMNVFLVLLLIKAPFFPKISFPSYDECFLILLILHMYVLSSFTFEFNWIWLCQLFCWIFQRTLGTLLIFTLHTGI